MVSFHVDIAGSPGLWRAAISPADRTGWFTSYGDTLTAYATLAQSAGASDLCLGGRCRQDTLSAENTAGWITLVRRVRTVFHGRLTYDANWDSQSGAVRFWSYLDYIGLSGYFPLAGNDSPASLATDWSHWDTAVVHPLATPVGTSASCSPRSATAASPVRTPPPTAGDRWGCPAKQSKPTTGPPCSHTGRTAATSPASKPGSGMPTRTWTPGLCRQQRRTTRSKARAPKVGVLRSWFGGAPTA